VFWELAENVPDGLPAGDFSLLLPRREGEDDFFDAEGNAEVNASETLSESSSAFESEDELEGGRGLYEEHPKLDGVCSESDASDASLGSVDDLLRGHAFRSRRFAKSGFWSDRTPLASASEGEESFESDGVSDAGSLWNSESEASFDLGSGSERDSSDETRRRRDAPSFLR
jgi:hypothetical protein